MLNDLWFASAENMHFVKLDLAKEFIMALKMLAAVDRGLVRDVIEKEEQFRIKGMEMMRTINRISAADYQ